MSTEITQITQDVEAVLSDKENSVILIETTFKGLTPAVARRAMIEGLIRGFTIKDFLQKDIYAIPFKAGYSLVTSISHSRKVGMRSGVCGKLAPKYTEKDGKIETCEVTVQRMVSGHLGDFTALVYFDEYFKKGNPGYPSLWETKPRTMIAKVAEMHAYRMACPEEMSQMFLEEEIERETVSAVELNIGDFEAKIRACTTVESLASVWSALPVEAKTALVAVKDEVKSKVTAPVKVVTADEVPPDALDQVQNEFKNSTPAEQMLAGMNEKTEKAKK